MLEVILILSILAFYMWRLFVFANAFGNKEETVKTTSEYKKETKFAKRYSIHRNIYE